MKKPLQILGIDPGYGRCGWGVIEVSGNRHACVDFGVIETGARDSFPKRLNQLHEQLRAVIARLTPTESAVEELFFAKNVKTAINVGQARGVAVLTCSQADLPVAEYKPVEIKMAVAGHGAATKQQVQRMVCMLLNLKQAPRLDDAADALAVAICHAHSRRLKKLI